MAFQLNVDQPFKAQPPRQDMTALLFATRQGLRGQAPRRLIQLSAAQAAVAAACFVLGLSVAELRPAHFGRTDGYDLTPTGSIATKAAGPTVRARFCD